MQQMRAVTMTVQSDRMGWHHAEVRSLGFQGQPCLQRVGIYAQSIKSRVCGPRQVVSGGVDELSGFWNSLVRSTDIIMKHPQVITLCVFTLQTLMNMKCHHCLHIIWLSNQKCINKSSNNIIITKSSIRPQEDSTKNSIAFRGAIIIRRLLSSHSQYSS